ncbi:enoyl-CoA hydratase/isomerase family protein [Stella sp.]|uniref:enoyl-CoA hydratase/isomerase family protein n=1 Tax=Stella sp. TaxID=2912054 RepID=UPI0035B42145
MTRPLCRVAEDDGVLTLTLDRPEKRNALDAPLLAELIQALEAAAPPRVLVLTGAGDAFCAGADLGPLKGIADPEERRRAFAPHAVRLSEMIGRVMMLLAAPGRISIAAVNGPAVGGGWILAMGCDFRIAADGARFWFPEIELGRAIGEASNDLLTAYAGPALAREIVMLARRYDAAELLALRLLNRVVPRPELLPAAAAMAARLAATDPAALATVKARIAAPMLAAALAKPWGR